GGRPALRAGHAGDQLQPGCVRSRRPGRAARGRWGRVRCTRRAGRDLSSLPGVGAAMIGTTPGDTGTTLPVAHAGTTARVAVRLLARRPGLLVLVVVSTVLAGVAGLVAPIALGRLVDQLYATAGAPADTRIGHVVTAAALTAGAGVLGGVLAWASWRWTAVLGESAVATLRHDVVGHALELDSALVESAGPGDLVSRVADDSRTVATASAQLVPMMVSSLVAVVVTAAGLLAIDWRLGLVGMVAIPMYG